MNDDMCIVDTRNTQIYDFVRWPRSVEEALSSAIEHNQKDILTWETHCKTYPDVEIFKQRLQEAKETSFVIMSYDEFLAQERNYYLSLPIQEISEEEYEKQLDVLPPLKWCTIDGVEMFCMSEMFTGTYTSQYAYDKRTGKYYTKMVNVMDRTTWINVMLS